MLALAGCGVLDRQAPLGRLIDRPPPPVTVVHGGPTGALIGGRFQPVLPDAVVDRVVAPALRAWLTFPERRSLAVASERAAIAPEGDAVEFKATNGTGAVTTQGAAAPVSDVYRSLRGKICRDLRQSVDKDKKTLALDVTLCREEVAGDITLWVVAASD
ncbi:MAG TPA: hypothetical protein VMU87_18935 [Stellaceae bacterium]|nr:hypothetical protein [Stellaceae bacterium]